MRGKCDENQRECLENMKKERGVEEKGIVAR